MIVHLRPTVKHVGRNDDDVARLYHAEVEALLDGAIEADKATGKEVGAIPMPAPQSGSPMTYSVNGRQYIVVAVSGGAYSGEYIAFRLPEE